MNYYYYNIRVLDQFLVAAKRLQKNEIQDNILHRLQGTEAASVNNQKRESDTRISQRESKKSVRKERGYEKEGPEQGLSSSNALKQLC